MLKCSSSLSQACSFIWDQETLAIGYKLLQVKHLIFCYSAAGDVASCAFSAALIECGRVALLFFHASRIFISQSIFSIYLNILLCK